jgi:Zn-dependent protease with chaperone function
MRPHPKLLLHHKPSLPLRLPLRLKFPGRSKIASNPQFSSLRRRLAAPLVLSPGSLLLYAVTFCLEAPVVIARVVIAVVFSILLMVITGHPGVLGVEPVDLALIPTFWSVVALAVPVGSGWWWRQCIGARQPSQREQLAYIDAIELLQANSTTPLPNPGTWFVLDTPEPDAAVLGDTLMLSRGLLDSPHLPAVLAHELGHLATPDGRVTAALNRLVISPPIYKPEPREREQNRETMPILTGDRIFLVTLAVHITIWVARKTIALARGGLGLWVLRAAWGAYWREREYTADQYAARLGQADELADFLEVHALIHDHPIPFIWTTDHTHPSTELRIDRLHTHAHTDVIDHIDTPPALPYDR